MCGANADHIRLSTEQPKLFDAARVESGIGPIFDGGAAINNSRHGDYSRQFINGRHGDYSRQLPDAERVVNSSAERRPGNCKSHLPLVSINGYPPPFLGLPGHKMIEATLITNIVKSRKSSSMPQSSKAFQSSPILVSTLGKYLVSMTLH